MTTPSPVRPPASCSKPEAPAHGRRLGRVYAVGHQVHFLCHPGYELVGPTTRVCLESARWSGRQPACRRTWTRRRPGSAAAPSPVLGFSSGRDRTRSSPLPSAAPPPPSTRASHCTHLLGSTRCTCDVGFTISGHDNSVCSGPRTSPARSSPLPSSPRLLPPLRCGRVPSVSSRPAGASVRPSVCQHARKLPLRLS